MKWINLRRNIKLYFLFGIVLAIAILASYILHKNAPVASEKDPNIHVQFIVFLLFFLDFVLTYIFYQIYKKFYFLFEMIIIVVIASPHILYGHLLIPEEFTRKHEQLIALILYLPLTYIIYFILKQQIDNIKDINKKISKTLIDSYQYIGKINREVNVIDKFINFFSFGQGLNKNKEKDIFNELLKNIINSVVKTNKGLIRFIKTSNNRTIKEFYYSKDNNPFIVKLSNNQIMRKKFNTNKRIKRRDTEVVLSDHIDSNIRCALCYPRRLKNSKIDIDMKLLKNLLKQIHLLFLVVYFKKK